MKIAILRTPCRCAARFQENRKAAYLLDAGGFAKPLGWLFFGCLQMRPRRHRCARPTLKTDVPIGLAHPIKLGSLDARLL